MRPNSKKLQDESGKPSHTKISYNNKDPLHSEGKTIKIPTWVITLIKVSAPALLALTFMYFSHVQVKSNVQDLMPRVTELERNDLRTTIRTDNIDKTLHRIERSIGSCTMDIKTMVETQHKIQTDIEVLKQK